MKKSKSRALRVVPKDPEAARVSMRTRILHLFRDADMPPHDALAVLISLVGTLSAASCTGRAKLLWACWKAYGIERRRLLRAKVDAL